MINKEISMKKSNCFLSLILFLCLNQYLVWGATIQPIERSVGKLKISIDPRIELLATIQLISNYPQINRNLPYSKDVLKYFENFSSQDAVKLTESLQQKYGFAYDAPVTFMLYLSQPHELEVHTELSDYLLGRSGGDDNLEQYRKSIKQFTEISNFEDFWNNKIPFYNQILDMTIANMGEIDFVKTLEGYYNETKGSYNVIISPAFIGGYASWLSRTDGKDDLYSCLSTTNIKDNIPYLEEDNLLQLVWHEFGHSFVNPITEKYAEKVKSIDKLLEPIKEEMSKQAYSQWYNCINEHIIRAVHVRLLALHVSSQQSNGLLNIELSKRFIYIEPLVEKLKDFEKRRDENNITFSEFYPELLDVLNSLLAIEY